MIVFNNNHFHKIVAGALNELLWFVVVVAAVADVVIAMYYFAVRAKSVHFDLGNVHDGNRQ